MALIKHSLRTVRKPCQRCGSSDLYWAHDTDRDGMACPAERNGKAVCANPGTSGKFTLINMDGSRHDCRNSAPKSPEPAPAWSPMPEPAPVAPEPVTAVTAPSNGASDKLKALDALSELLSPKVDAAMVRDMIAEQNDVYSAKLMDAVQARIETLSVPVTVKIDPPSGEVKTIEGAHKILPTLVKVVANARKHVLLVGPAGTGKSHLASQVAGAMGLDFREISLTPAMSPTALLGYMQAEGKYVGTAFRQVYEHGGVFHFDEMDNAHPSILAVINAALANGHCEFPDARVTKHPDTYIVASANTYGRGADRVYVGRQALDGATLDRFVVIPVDYDEGLESSLCEATGLDTTTVFKALRYVRSIRANAETGRMPLIFSVRGSVNLCALLHAGIPASDAIEYTIRKGIADTDWNKVTQGVMAPAL